MINYEIHDRIFVLFVSSSKHRQHSVCRKRHHRIQLGASLRFHLSFFSITRIALMFFSSFITAFHDA